jgi:hypothetical protein
MTSLKLIRRYVFIVNAGNSPENGKETLQVAAQWYHQSIVAFLNAGADELMLFVDKDSAEELGERTEWRPEVGIDEETLLDDSEYVRRAVSGAGQAMAGACSQHGFHLEDVQMSKWLTSVGPYLHQLSGGRKHTKQRMH